MSTSDATYSESNYDPETFDELFNDPENFNVNLPQIPQLLSNNKYKELIHQFCSIGKEKKEPFSFQLRSKICKQCNVLQKPRNLTKSGYCSYKGKDKQGCKPITLSTIPHCIKILNKNEKNSLRLLKIYVENQYHNKYDYERFKGTAKLSLNWNVWVSCSGLIGLNSDYNQRKPRYNFKVLSALRWLIKHNHLYKNIEFPQATLDCFLENSDIVGSSTGEVFTVPRNIDQSFYGTDDANKNILPVGDIVKNGVKEVIGPTFNPKDAYLYPYLYTDGNNSIENNMTARAMSVRQRLFHKDPRFRKCASWIFIILMKWRSLDW